MFNLRLSMDTVSAIMTDARELELFHSVLGSVTSRSDFTSTPQDVAACLERAREAITEVGKLIDHGAMKEYFSVSENRYAHYLAAAETCLDKQASILDLGNAPGHAAIGLWKLGFRLIQGINLNAEWRALYPTSDWLRTFNVIEHDIEAADLPFLDQSFDAVLFTEILEHIAVRDPSAIVAEMRRVLRPGGVVIFSTPNIGNISNIYALMHGRNVFWRPELFYGSLDRHNREYTIDEVEACFAQGGLSRRWIWGINDHSNWREGGGQFAYDYIAAFGDDHELTRNTIVAVYERTD